MTTKHPMVGQLWRNMRTGRLVRIERLWGAVNVDVTYSSGRTVCRPLRTFEIYFERVMAA